MKFFQVANLCMQLRYRWKEGQPISRIPIDDNPDLRYCLLHQQLQLINCYIARRKKRVTDLASFETLSSYVAQEQSSPPRNIDKHTTPLETINGNPPVLIYAKIKIGEKVLRLGADRPAGDLLMLETGEPVYSPITQVRKCFYSAFSPFWYRLLMVPLFMEGIFFYVEAKYICYIVLCSCFDTLYCSYVGQPYHDRRCYKGG